VSRLAGETPGLLPALPAAHAAADTASRPRPAAALWLAPVAGSCAEGEAGSVVVGGRGAPARGAGRALAGRAAAVPRNGPVISKVSPPSGSTFLAWLETYSRVRRR
jgi:hypothetical protein